MTERKGLVCIMSLMVAAISAIAISLVVLQPSGKVLADANVFVMEEKASVRLVDGTSGIRFKVKMDDAVKDAVLASEDAGVLVFPKAYLTEDVITAGNYIDKKVQNGTVDNTKTGLYDYLKVSGGHSQMQVYKGKDGWYANACVINVLPQNFQRDFAAIAFYKNAGGNYVYADFNAKFGRSITTVLSKAYIYDSDLYAERIRSIYGDSFATQANPVRISDKGDYTAFVNSISTANTYENLYVRIENNINLGSGNGTGLPRIPALFKGTIVAPENVKLTYRSTTGSVIQAAENTAVLQGIYECTTVNGADLFKSSPDYTPRNGVKKEWDSVCSYFCNYGQFQDEMTRYDVAIIGEGMLGTFNKFNLGDPKVDTAGMRALKDAGVWTIGYITLGEDYALNIGDGMGPGGYASYYLYDENGMPRANGDWESYFVDPANPVWEKIILAEVQRLADAGCDGIFMDTCDSVDHYPETKNDLVNLVKTIRKAFPGIKMVLNRGFQILPYVYDIIDGDMFEVFATALKAGTSEYEVLSETSGTFQTNVENAVKKVNASRLAHYYPVFSLEYLPSESTQKQQVYNRCWEYDFIPYLSTNGRVLDGTMTSFDLHPDSVRGSKALGSGQTALSAPSGIPDKIPAVTEPARPVLTGEADAAQYPVVTNYLATTDAYELTNAESGVSVSYPKAGEELVDYNFIYADVGNYTEDYHYLRIDMNNISGVGKIAVAVCYDGQEEDQPAVGVLVEDVFEGNYSLVSDLSKFNTIKGNYGQSGENLAKKRITRLYLFFDSNPCQHPSDKQGSLVISNIGFYKKGDEGSVVDNSPKPGEVSVPQGGYTLASPSDEYIFSASYKNVQNGKYIRMNLDRYRAAYCKGSLSYTAKNAHHAVIKSGDKVIAETDLAAADDILLDLREIDNVEALDFYIDNGLNNEGTFTLKSFALRYTPYVTAGWEATNNMEVTGCAIGGICKATYDKTLGWDCLRVPVKNYIPEYSRLVINFKSYGTESGDKTEYIGLAINSNDVLVELSQNPVSSLPFNEAKSEWTMTVDLSGKKNISSLSFYFDAVSDFVGRRTIEFTSVEFMCPENMKIGEIKQVYGSSYDISEAGTGGTVIKWGGTVTTKAKWGYLNVKVSGYAPGYGNMLKVVLSSASENTTIGIWRRNNNAPSTDWCVYSHAAVGKANEDVTINVPISLKAGEAGLPEIFELLFYFDADKTTSGTVTVKSIEITSPEMRLAQIFDNKYTIEGNKISWGTDKGEWSYLICDFRNIRPGTKHIMMTLSTTDPDATIGFHHAKSDVYWYPNQTIGAANSVIDIPVPESAGENFTLNLYVYAGTVPSQTGSFTIKNIEFSDEAYIGKIKQVSGSSYNISEDGTGGTVIRWGGDVTTKAQWDCLNVKVSGYAPGYGNMLKVVLASASKDTTIGIWRRNNNDSNTDWCVYSHTAVGKANEDVEIRVPLKLKEGEAGLPEMFELLFYFDGGKTTSGTVTVKSMEFISSLLAITQNLDNAYTIDEEAMSISWQADKPQWSMIHFNFLNVEETVKTIKLTVTCTDAEAGFGLHYPGNGQYLFGHEVLGSEKVIEISVPEHEGTDFVLDGYVNAAIPEHKAAGTITITGIEYIKE